MCKNCNHEWDCESCSFHEICFLGCHRKGNTVPSCRATEVFLGIFMTIFGLVLILPFDTFATYKVYNTLSYVANELHWGLIAVVAGVYQLLIALKKVKRMHKIISLSIHSFVWSFIASMFVVNDIMNHTISTGFSTYGCLAGLSLYLAYRLSD